MEIQTTLKELPDRIKQLDISPDTRIRLIIEEIRDPSGKEKSHFPFLYGKVWTDVEGPIDISENVDAYLYDTEDIHTYRNRKIV